MILGAVVNYSLTTSPVAILALVGMVVVSFAVEVHLLMVRGLKVSLRKQVCSRRT
jgi:hypothetical protein